MSEPSPLELTTLVGHERALGQWKEALETNRLHHAWLLQGPRGVGKAHLALRMGAEMLGVPSGIVDHPVAQLIKAGSHPDLRIVQVPVDDKGKARTEIPVDSIRELSRFFSMRPAMGGWRIGILDSIGELNRNGANAILKTLEEPPPRCVLFLVVHDGDFVLPTIRSRCRMLKLSRLSDAETLKVLETEGLHGSDAKEAAQLAPGQPGVAMSLAGTEGLAGAKAARALLSSRRDVSAQALSDLVKAGGKSRTSFDAALTIITRELTKRARTESDATKAGRLATQAADIGALWREAEGLNMDRAQALVRVVDILRDGVNA